MTKLLEVKHLQKNFGKFQALKDITFDIEEGEVLGFIGPNGAGKSTTLRLLLGLIRKSGGEAKIFGLDVWKDAIAIHKRIAYVPGDVYLWPNLTGGEIIDLFMKLQGNGDSAKKDELIKKFELDPRKKARSYSKGNRQKIALIAALSARAELYLFDEPTSGLDPIMEAVFQEEVARIKSEGHSILLSSHILSEVERLADSVAVIKEGVIVDHGSLADLRHFTRETFKIETNLTPEPLAAIEGIYDLEFSGHQAQFQADSEKIQEILQVATGLGVRKLESSPATLEELFLHHYERNSDANTEILQNPRNRKG